MRNLRLALVAALGEDGARGAVILDASLYIEEHWWCNPKSMGDSSEAMCLIVGFLIFKKLLKGRANSSRLEVRLSL